MTRRLRSGAATLLAATLALSPPAAASPPAGTSPPAPTSAPSAPPRETTAADPEPEDPQPGAADTAPYRSRSTASPAWRRGRAASSVDRAQMAERLPRSAPDALRYEPGVTIQQTAHAQASPYVRGRTGQQTALYFDGVRLNHSLFRQGPNQYFFTVDAASIDRIDVVRGSASTVFGSDAIAGAIEAVPIAPLVLRDAAWRGSRGPNIDVNPAVTVGYESASDTRSVNARVGAAAGRVGVEGGGGYREAGLLRSGGPVGSPVDGSAPEVPRFEPDGVTQRGTGFDELTSDAHVAWPVGSLTARVAAFNYRQTDAPRTDQCAPPFAPFDECMRYEEQFRTLAYAGLDGPVGPLADLTVRLSWQQQHERRRHDRPSTSTFEGGRDDVTTLGVRAVATTHDVVVAPRVAAAATAGVDAYADRVDSAAWITFTDVDVTRLRSRGQYVAGSRYTTGGGFAMARVMVADRLGLRGGGRVAAVSARSPGDDASTTSAVDQHWSAGVGGAGAELRVSPALRITGGADQGFRAPNLDDLTSRQRTGPGYQLENAALLPERAWTLEAGIHVETPALRLDAWAYRLTTHDAITRVPRTQADCPAGLSDCAASWSVVQLVNADGPARIVGAEGSIALDLPAGISLRGTAAWAEGSEPHPSGRGRQPVSRVPPLNGTAEARWLDASGWWLGGALRWATLQDRLAVTDRADARIPLGGTPGYAVADLRAGFRSGCCVAFTAILENVTDAAYRVHGSSVNGAGRSLVAQIAFGSTRPSDAP